MFFSLQSKVASGIIPELKKDFRIVVLIVEKDPNDKKIKNISEVNMNVFLLEQCAFLNADLEKEVIDPASFDKHLKVFAKVFQQTDIKDLSKDDLNKIQSLIHKINVLFSSCERAVNPSSDLSPSTLQKVRKCVERFAVMEGDCHCLKFVLSEKLQTAIEEGDGAILLYVMNLLPDNEAKMRSWKSVWRKIVSDSPLETRKNLIESCMAKAATAKEFCMVTSAIDIIARDNSERLQYYKEMCLDVQKKPDSRIDFFSACIDESLKSNDFSLVRLSDSLLLSGYEQDSDSALSQLVKALPESERKELFEKFSHPDLDRSITIFCNQSQSMLKAALGCRDFSAALSIIAAFPNKNFREVLWKITKEFISEENVGDFFSSCIRRVQGEMPDSFGVFRVASKEDDFSVRLEILDKLDEFGREVLPLQNEQKKMINRSYESIVREALESGDKGKELAVAVLPKMMEGPLKSTLTDRMIKMSLRQRDFSTALKVVPNMEASEELIDTLFSIADKALEVNDLNSACSAAKDLASRSFSEEEFSVSSDGTDSEHMSVSDSSLRELLLKIEEKAEKNSDSSLIEEVKEIRNSLE